jgi:hypothetical protein
MVAFSTVDPSGPGSQCLTSTGTISSLKVPCSMAARALRWLSAARASCSNRLTLNLEATFSAVSPMLRYTSGLVSIMSPLNISWLPPPGTRDMDSTPPHSMTSAMPDMMAWPPSAMACRPDEQKRLSVKPGTDSGSPAIRA